MTPILSMDRVERRYGSHRVLSNATFDVDPGEVAGVIGPNGAGKTTMLRIAVGLLHAHGGSVRLAKPAGRGDVRDSDVAYFGGESTVPGGVREQRWRALFHDIDGRARNRPIRLLSRGTRQLLGLRTVMGISGLRLIVLDEPWEGLDPDGARWLTGAIRARRDAGAAVLVSSHRLHDLAGVCDRYIFLHCGSTTSVAAEALETDGAVTGDALMAAFDLVRGVPG